MQAKHTKGKWKWGICNETDSETIFIFSDEFGGVAKIPAEKQTEEHKANAELICRAVNSHEQW